MASVDNIRNQLIQKILAIRNEEFLLALDKILSAEYTPSSEVPLTKEQELMLQMSEEDIEEGRTVPHNQVMEKAAEWLRKRKS